jgi:hypothetical protein
VKLRVVIAAALGLSIPVPASAYVRTVTTSGTPIAWTSGCLEFQTDTLANPLVSNSETRATLDAAIAQWNAGDKGKTAFTVSRGADVSGMDVAFDHISVVLWRLPGFCDHGAHADDEACLAPEATATTTVYFHDSPGAPDDGEIVEADMEVNAVHFSFGDDGNPSNIDLQSVFAHETGHAIGLDHTCYVNAAATPLVDDLGDPQPYCYPTSALPDYVTAATMFNFISPGETDKRGPTADETLAATTIYAKYDGSCANNDAGQSGGCSVATVPRAGWCCVTALIMGVLELLLLRRRRR